MEARTTGFQTFEDLSIVQIGTSDQDTLEYISCGKAIAGGKLHLMEVSPSGSVNTITVLNETNACVFLMDGDVLTGAKQNRVVNTSILLSPHSKTHIPVSCVEQGRWSSRITTFRPSEFTAPLFMRASKASQVHDNLKRRGEFAADQGRIWDGVAEYQAALHTSSPTSCLSDTFDGMSADLDRLLKSFSIDEHANGLAVFLGKKFAGIDVFNRREVFAEYFQKLLRGAALEFRSRRRTGARVEESEASFRTLDALDQFAAADFEENPGVGVGTDRRCAAGKVEGFELVFSGHPVHMALFAAEH